jgi:hypothetical protein
MALTEVWQLTMEITVLVRGMLTSGRHIIRKGWTSADDVF